ncbi:NAD(P)-binding Rossmann-fold containing protein [Glarea lozoyensis ATCC 20868]|uniref:NAD(P)-binding Rossmann-fold containing protein n=1 Tax=Glarea lozoyensis (strain ATCC 20868 / MF5171) TaxID=1116229 RepID=S3CE69_GLAL2|nr:NAD(P)-binding Rossmann-fold containing protein [Glarea lozoyensis ATCC 20868]EPE24280.1 NAD(P)-binding Rossmann-fold containing protein [Glarea lozoyensis ATCC 20868]
MSALITRAQRLAGPSRIWKSVFNRRTFMHLQSFSLEGKTCVVTGAGRGLGKEFLTAFSLSGAKGACVDLSLEAGNNSIRHIKEHISSESSAPESYRPELRAYACDVTSEAQVRDTWQAIVKDLGKIDVVVTAAGIVDNVEAENYGYDRWKKMLDVNLNGTFLFAREAGKYWIEQKMNGNLILVASMSGKICVRPQKQSAYNAWGPKGIRVNSLCPGYVKTDLIIDLLEKEGKHIEENWVKDIPLGRLAHPSELQGTIVWMASNASSYLNGSDIVVDGGYCCY